MNLDQKTEDFFSKYPSHHFLAKAIIIDAGVKPEGVYYLESGHVRQYLISSEGQELTLHIFELKSFFPMIWAMSHIPNRYFFEAIDQVTLRIAPVDQFEQFLLSEPELLFRFSQRLLMGLNGMLLRVESLSLQNARMRVISILVYIARHFGQRDGNQVLFRPYFTHQELATLTGMARETTSVEMSKLEKEGLIAYQDTSFIILDLARLEALLQE